MKTLNPTRVEQWVRMEVRKLERAHIQVYTAHFSRTHWRATIKVRDPDETQVVYEAEDRMRTRGVPFEARDGPDGRDWDIRFDHR